MTESQLVRLVGALAALLATSQLLAGGAQWMRQPRVAGEILVAATALKAAATWLGARLAGQPASVARQLAEAMNARGAMGIVLASLALEAGVVNGAAHATLVLVALVTTLAAGACLRAERLPSTERTEAAEATK